MNIMYCYDSATDSGEIFFWLSIFNNRYRGRKVRERDMQQMDAGWT